MPCMGPDMEGARKMGREIGEQLFNELVERHRLWDITDPKYKGMFCLPGAKKRWERNRNAFIAVVGRIFEEDAANSF